MSRISVLVIAEKPSVASDIAKVLKANTKKGGYFQGSGYIVAWCVGHLVELSNAVEYDEKYKKWNIDNIPIVPDEFRLTVKERTKSQFDILKRLMNDKSVTEVVCATDAGREGQLIFEWAYKKAGCDKPVKRLWISSMTDSAISEGFAKLKDNSHYFDLYMSAQSRSHADWLVGINGTIAMTVINNTLLKIGRVMTPTLALIVNRQREIDNFVSVPFYTVEGDFNGSRLQRIDKDGKTRIDDKGVALAIKEKCADKEGLVTKFETKKKNEERPLLYDLTELQRDANNKFALSTQETLDILQTLYEKYKVVTYPRTDSRYLSKDIVPSLKGRVEGVGKAFPHLEKIAEKLATRLNTDTRVVNDKKVSDHHAIIVTEELTKANLDAMGDRERKVLALVVARFLVSLSSKHEYLETQVIVEVEGESFKNKGKKVTKEGWKYIERIALAPVYDVKESGDVIIKIDGLGEKVIAQNVEIAEKQTTPPKPYTEATLLSAMENIGRTMEDELKEFMKAGLGTPATRAGTIEKLLACKYIERKGKNLIPTDIGGELIDVVPDEIKSPTLTGNWEEKLEEIKKGNLDNAEFEKDVSIYIKEVVEKIRGNNSDFRISTSRGDNSPIAKCPRCGRAVHEFVKSYSCVGYKEEPKCDFSLWKDNAFLKKAGKKFTREIAAALITDGNVVVDNLKAQKTGKMYKARLVLKDTGSGFANFEVKFD